MFIQDYPVLPPPLNNFHVTPLNICATFDEREIQGGKNDKKGDQYHRQTSKPIDRQQNTEHLHT